MDKVKVTEERISRFVGMIQLGKAEDIDADDIDDLIADHNTMLAEIKRLTDKLEALEGLYAAFKPQEYEPGEVVTTTGALPNDKDAELARLRAEVEKIESSERVFLLWRDERSVLADDEFVDGHYYTNKEYAEEVMRSRDDELTLSVRPFALVPVEDKP